MCYNNDYRDHGNNRLRISDYADFYSRRESL